MSERSFAPAASPLVPLAPGFVSVPDAASALGLSKRSVQRAIQRGELVAVKQGRTLLVATAALEDYQARRDGEPGTRPALAPILHLVELSPADIAELAPPTPVPAATPAPSPIAIPEWASLPAPLTSFVGRHEELTTLTGWLANPANRLLTITGIGGVGKTRLAREAAAAALNEFPGGVRFISLAAVSDPAAVLPAIVTALGVRDTGEPALAALKATFTPTRALLVLDNLEQVIAAAPDLADLLVAAPGLTLLTTSRTMLRLTGERILPLAPMPIGSGTPVPVTGDDHLAPADAVQLLIERAQQARPGFTATPDLMPLLTKLCRQLDGLPLAIELAAARIAVLSPAALLARLENRLSLLTGGPIDQPDRLRTMRGAIAWSYGLLPPAEQALMRRLAIFPGGLTLEAIEAMAAAPISADGAATDDLDRSGDVFDHLASLVDGSLLQMVTEPTGDRYVMLETVREFALEQLALSGEFDAAAAAQAAHLRDVAVTAAPVLRLAVDETRLRAMEREHDNMLAALSWATTHGPVLALELAAALSPYWDKRGHWAAGRDWLTTVIAAAPDAPAEVRLRAYAAAGMLALNQRDFPAATIDLQLAQGLIPATTLSDTAGSVERSLGILASHQSDFAAASTHFTAAKEHYRAANNRVGLANCLNDLALVAARSNDLDTAIPLAEEALSLIRATGDRWQLCLIAGNLAGFYTDNGNLARGEVMLDEALSLSRELGDTIGVAINLHNLGNIAASRGESEAAARRYLELLPITLELGEQQLSNRTLDRLGQVLQQLGALRPAARLFGAAAANRTAIGDTLFAGELEYFEAIWAPVREQLGADLFTAAHEAGSRLTLDQAIAEGTLVTASALAAHAQAAAAPGIVPAAAPGNGIAPASGAPLTRREQEVLRLIAAGRSDREIADTLFVARTTASKHVSAILAKLEAGSRTEAVAIALRHQLL